MRKSLTAKATAALFKLPLLPLDVGSLMGKYVGESENNMRRALRLADAVSPCVLWVDELEKAFVGPERYSGNGAMPLDGAWSWSGEPNCGCVGRSLLPSI